MSPENTRKLMGFYMEALILGVMLQYMVCASFPIGRIALYYTMRRNISYKSILQYSARNIGVPLHKCTSGHSASVAWQRAGIARGAGGKHAMKWVGLVSTICM